MTDEVWTINRIQTVMRQRGSHWWDPSTMRHFRCHVLPEVYQGPGGIYFVSSEAPSEDGPRCYTVRQFTPETGEIDSAGDGLAAYECRKDALKAAKELSGASVVSAREPHKPITVLEQFVNDLAKHCTGWRTAPNSPMGVGLAKALIKHAAMHQRHMVAQCNGTWPYTYGLDADGEHPKVVRQLRSLIHNLAMELGVNGVIFGGDPRGCTCKFTFVDGFTNDFGKEGYCVPQSEKGDV